MKTTHFSMLVATIMLMACSSNQQPSLTIRTGEAISSPGAGMVIVKFADSKQSNYVIASHPIKKYDGIAGCYVYDEEGPLGLNIAYNSDSYLTFNTAEHAPFFENRLQLLGSSPYISLGKDYYLIDWKWQQLLPISATCNYPQPDRGDLLDMAQNHCYLTNVRWKNLKSLSTQWSQSDNLPAVRIQEIYRLNIRDLEKYLSNTPIDHRDFLCYNNSLYSDGLSVINVMSYWMNRNNSSCHSQDAYLDCIDYYDYLQNIYVQELKQIISQGKLDQIPLSR